MCPEQRESVLTDSRSSSRTNTKVLAALNLLAFNFHNVCDVLDDLWKRARKKAGKRTSSFSGIFHACDFFIFETWQELFDFMLVRKPPASIQVNAAGP